MEEAQQQDNTFTLLVTGANSGLGFSICCRAIDEFLLTRQAEQTLHLLFSTRDAAKSQDTHKRLTAHLRKTLKSSSSAAAATANGQNLGGKKKLLDANRIRLEGVFVDLLKLRSVKALADQLLQRGERLDAVVWNAGIAGWSGLNWPKAIWHICTDLVHASTYPTYPLGIVGATTRSQLVPRGEAKTQAQAGAGEPPLGQVFTANVFGHYMLTHWLAPLLHGGSRIVWVSSISAVPETFAAADLQGLRAKMAYEGSKRLTDYLVLTSELPSTRPFVDGFLSPGTAAPRQPDQKPKKGAVAEQDPRASAPPATPKMYLTHPGVIGTSIAGLPALLETLMFLAFYLARLLGSPWHPVAAYKGAVSPVFAALAPAAQLPDLEVREGKGKWGSAVGVFGDERVARTEVEGWGFCGRVGVVPENSVAGKAGRFRGRRETDRESREEFEVVGRRVWREMEELRVQWEGLLMGEEDA